MRWSGILFISVLLLLGVVWGFNIKEYISPNESVEDVAYTDMAGPDGVYTLYYLDDEPLLMVHDNNIVQDRNTIKSVLERYYFSKDFLKNDDIEDIRSAILEFNQSRSNFYYVGHTKTPRPPEAYCLQISGWSTRTCYDKESCLLTCASVPVCKFALEGLGQEEKFLFNILYLGTNVTRMNEDINYVLDSLDHFSELEYSDYSDEDRERLETMFDKMRDIREAAQNIEDNFLFSDLLPSPGLQSFCAPVNYSSSALDRIVYLADLYDDQLSNLVNVDDVTDELITNTGERIKLKETLETQNKYTKELEKIENNYDELYSKYVKIYKVLKDETLESKMSTLKYKKDSIQQYIYKGEYSKSDLTIKQYWVLANDLDDLIDEYFAKVQKLNDVRAQIEKKSIVARWDVEFDNVFLNQQLNEALDKKNRLDTKISNEKISPDELDDVIAQYESVLSDLDEIIEVKREHTLDMVLDGVVSLTNSYSDLVASAYQAVADGGYQTKKNVRQYVFPVTLAIIDFGVIVAFVGAFMYMLTSGKIRLHKTAAVLWTFIFISFFLSIAGGSLATYLVINEKSVKTSFEAFVSDLSASDNVAVVLDNRDAVISDRTCLNTLKQSFVAMGKTVSIYTYNLDGCTKPDGSSASVDDCSAEVESMPAVILRKSDADQTSFTRSLHVTAEISGSEDYIRRCQLGTLLQEV